MELIDPHIHMVSRTTDDYERMAMAQVVAVTEPAFWAGFDRGGPTAFDDYFRQLTIFEPSRAAKFGIQHYAWICINAKEADDVTLSREVIKLIPQYLACPTVLGVGEIGLNKNTRNELLIFEEQLDLALRHDQLVLIHTPHLADKRQGTEMILGALRDHRADPARVLVDHVEEHTIRMVLDAGYWAGMTLYPVSKCSPKRAVDMIERYGPERLMANSAGDWGVSDPMNLPRTLLEFRRRGHSREAAMRFFHDNPCRFFGQCPKWQIAPILD